MIRTSAIAAAPSDSRKGSQVEIGVRGKLGRQVVMAYKHGPGRERGIAEDVIGMFVRVDDVADGPIGDCTDGSQQRASNFDAATGIDDRNRIPPDNNAEVSDVAVVHPCGRADFAEKHQVIGGDLPDCMRRRRCLAAVAE